MLEESRVEFLLRWHLYRRWHNPPNPTRKAEYILHKMLGSLPNGVFLDLGANVGAVTAKALEYGLDVIAFEPGPKALTHLRRRFQSNPKVQIIPKAVGNSQRRATFFHLPDNTESSSLMATDVSAAGEAIEVEVVDLVAFIKNLDRPVVGIKMDIEGAEAECLEAILDAGLHHSIDQLLVETHESLSTHLAAQLDAIRKRIADERISNICLDWL